MTWCLLRFSVMALYGRRTFEREFLPWSSVRFWRGPLHRGWKDFSSCFWATLRYLSSRPVIYTARKVGSLRGGQSGAAHLATSSRLSGHWCRGLLRSFLTWTGTLIEWTCLCLLKTRKWSPGRGMTLGSDWTTDKPLLPDLGTTVCDARQLVHFSALFCALKWLSAISDIQRSAMCRVNFQRFSSLWLPTWATSNVSLPLTNHL